MGKMALDKKNSGATIRCTVVVEVGQALDQPQPVERARLEGVLATAIAQAGHAPE
eukprot:COSAG01_NODE_12046_length_1808_cov_4.321240_1_plen_55_part_10